MNHLGLWRNFWRSWRQHTTLQVTTFAVLMGSFVVITTAILIHHNLDRILVRWGSSMQMSIYLQEEVTENQRVKIESELKQKRDFKEIKYVSKKAAAAQFSRKLKDLVPELLEDKGFGNPLPASYEVSLHKNFSNERNFQKLLTTVSVLEDLPGVDEVLYGKGWVENYAVLVSSFKWASWAGIILLIVGTFLVVGNSIRSSIYQRQEEIEVLELFGATPAMIQVPYIFEGAILGTMSASVSVAICYLLYLGQESVLSGSLGFWGLSSTLSFLSLGKIFLVIFMGTFAGSMGSYLCVYKISNGWAAADKMGNEFLDV